jgi:ribA/ribD-fused uncharacterized protein
MSETVDAKLLLKFYKLHPKRPERAVYMKDGNLQLFTSDRSSSSKSKGDSKFTIIPLPTYRKPTATELEEQDAVRMEVIRQLEADFEKARQELFQITQSGTSTKGEILRLNRAVEEADIAINAARFPLRDIYIYNSIPIREILLDEFDERSLFKVISFIYRTHELQNLYVREGEVNPDMIAEEEAKDAKKAERAERRRYRRAGIIFIKAPDTNEYGFLSLDWPVLLEIAGTQYRSAKHALFGELAKALNDTAMFDRIRKTKDPLTLTYTYTDSPGVVEERWNSKRAELIQKILREKFRQHPELAERLVMTGEAVLAADVMGDTLFGIGLSIDDPKAQKPRKWTGQNLIGKVLEQIRTEQMSRRDRAEESIVQTLTRVAGDAVEGLVDRFTPAPAPELVPEPALEPAPEPALALAPTKSKRRVLRIVSESK